MELSDITKFSWTERFRHYLKQNTRPGEHPTQQTWDHCVDEANEEMLDEIHTMLYALCVNKGLINDDESICRQQEISRGNKTP